ncbi:U3 small nucleolar ribonucleoprotein protein MPP10 [Drosophila innubila]|uniref:U3 small nucleolar ribonucleoprotein protein MPP10 n=1 Tax=Drosophila innubila TaxID=198719 RepID=UPI00148C2575|nr:U3 small nucleolar ribonucleoprotein protein MPP10 [Drosophila innubila]
MAGNNRSKKITTKTNTFKEIAENFDQLVSHADRFLKPQPERVDAIHRLIQQTYGVSISSDVDNQKDVLPELVLDQMDEEQIWQQLELRNDLVFPQFLKQTAHLTAIREQNLGIELDNDDDDDDDKLSEPEGEQEEAEKDEQQSELEEDSDGINERPATKSKQINSKTSKKGRKSVVDDTFFKLDEMKQFLEQEDAKEMRRHNKKNQADDSEAIDHFAEDFGVGEESDDDNDVNVNYADFFEMDDELQEEAQKLPKDKDRAFFNENDNEEDENEAEASDGEHEDEEEAGDVPSEIDEADFVAQSGVEPASASDSEDDDKSTDEEAEQEKEKISNAPQSSNEMREVRLLQRIRDYEDVVLGDKPWQLRGEVQAGSRPQNSLLEEILEFDSTRRPVAAITEEENETIEDIIKQRIRDKAWDDVVRTVRPVHTPQEYRKQLVLDQEKSKQSLAQIYEQQYQQELDKLDPNRDADDSTAPEPKEHQEIKRAMRSLFLKLDALSNFHFTPKPVAPEIKIVTNTPAVHMEEVAPVAVSDAKLLAPEEVFRGPKHTPLGKTERTRTDKNRERRKKKQKQRAINAAVEMRDLQRAKEGKAPTQREANAKLLKSITKSRNVQKITTSNDQGALKSSKAFFNKLQDTTTATSTTTGSKRPKKDLSKANAKKLKL